MALTLLDSLMDVTHVQFPMIQKSFKGKTIMVRVLEPGHLEKINQSGRSLRTKDSNF